MNLADQIQALYAQYGEIPGVSIEIHKELIAIAIQNTHAKATIFLQGAQIAQYQRHNEAATLWLSPECDYKEGHPLRGGIPICWPWFGDFNKNPAPLQQQYDNSQSLPAHGFARNKQWSLDSLTPLQDGSTQLVFSLQLSPEAETYWHFNCALRYTVTIGKTLTVELSVTNLSDEAFTYSSALHSYLAIANINKVSIEGLEQNEYIDCSDNWTNKTQDNAITFHGEVDRIYQPSNSSIVLRDAEFKRNTTLAAQGSQSCVVWNPGAEKSKTLSCFNNEAYKEMLCIETANALSDAVHLEPQQQHRVQLTIT